MKNQKKNIPVIVESQEDIKAIFNQIILKGYVNAFITGPRDNVLKCATVDDWVKAASILQDYGVSCLSPGGYGGSSQVQRQKVHNDIYRAGKLCAVSFDKRTYVFQIRNEGKGYLYVLTPKKKI